MPDRVDLKYNYTRFSSSPSPGFPDKSVVFLPVVPIVISHGDGSVKTFALLDTGAEVSFFSTQFADALGIDWKTAPDAPFAGIASQKNPGHAVDVRLVLPDARYGWPARVVFSPAVDKFRLPLLGHTGFFEHFEVRFKTAQKQFRIHLK